HTDDLGDHRAGELHSQPAAGAGAIPHPEHEAVRSVPEQRSSIPWAELVEFLADVRLAEPGRLVAFAVQAVSQDGVSDAVRGLQAGDLDSLHRFVGLG